jgi:uncharacterized protein YhbP (UPF0306 family)
MIMYHYATSLSLELRIWDEDGAWTVKPFYLADEVNILLDENRFCGAHNYYYDNRTIHFIITNERFCRI